MRWMKAGQPVTELQVAAVSAGTELMLTDLAETLSQPWPGRPSQRAPLRDAVQVTAAADRPSEVLRLCGSASQPWRLSQALARVRRWSGRPRPLAASWTF